MADNDIPFDSDDMMTAKTPAAPEAAEEAQQAAVAEKARRKRRGEAAMIADGIKALAARFDAYANEAASGSVEAAIERGEVVTEAECQRRIKAAKAEVRAELRQLLSEKQD